MGAGMVLAQVMVAMMVTVGVLSMMRWIRQLLLTPKQVTVAVMVMTETDAESLDILLSEAIGSDARGRGAPVVVIIQASLMKGTLGDGETLWPHVQGMIDAYGAIWYTVEKEGREFHG